MAQHHSITLSEAEYAQHTDLYNGFCLACRQWTTGGCEPDMRKGTCPLCNAKQVYGAEELLMMGLISFDAGA